MNIRIGKIEISLMAVPLWLLLFWWNDATMLVLLLSCAFAHEAGHLVAAVASGAKIDSFRLGITGAHIALKETFLSYRKEIWIYVSGGICNLLYATVCFGMLHYRYSDTLLFLLFANLFYCVFNLLPISGLDGGEALKAYLSMKSDPVQSYEICRRVSLVGVICLFFASCGLLFWSKCNLSLLVICLSLMLNLQNEGAGRRNDLTGQ